MRKWDVKCRSERVGRERGSERVAVREWGEREMKRERVSEKRVGKKV